MKKLLSILLIASVLFTGCANSIPDGPGGCNGGQDIESVGLLTQDEKLPNVKYKICVGNVIWGVILVETIFMPIYFWGFSCFEPVRIIDQNKVCN